MLVVTKTELEECSNYIKNCRTEVAKRVVGQKEVIDGIIMALIAGGHVLLEGVPGLAKTLAVKTFAEISGLEYKRIQFTPDLLPAGKGFPQEGCAYHQLHLQQAGDEPVRQG